MNTKEKIIKKATQEFNKKGFNAISLFELAQKMEMSRGNLTYHFKDKEVLLEAISNEMWGKIEKERSKSRQLPSFENLHNEVQLYYKFQKEYGFIFLDNHVLNHPLIKKQFQEITKQTIKDNQAAIAFSIQIGNMRPEPAPGIYYNLALTVWMMTFYWLSQKSVRGKNKKEDGEKLIWSLLIPHMTEKGIASFKKFFGEKYFETLGPPFDFNIQSYISF